MLTPTLLFFIDHERELVLPKKYHIFALDSRHEICGLAGVECSVEFSTAKLTEFDLVQVCWSEVGQSTARVNTAHKRAPVQY